MITKAWNIVFVCIAVLYGTNAQIDAWATPNINTNSGQGTLEVAEDETVGTTLETYVATPHTDNTIASYTLLTTGTPFAVDETSGDLTLESALDFETAETYTIEIRAVDNVTPSPNSGTATIIISVTNVNEAPAFASATLTACVADGSTADQSVTTLTATDPDASDTITYTIQTGDTNNHFKFSGAELQVNTGITLDMATTASYTLGIRATDAASATGDTTLTVTVGSCNGATALGISIMMTLMALVVSLY